MKDVRFYEFGYCLDIGPKFTYLLQNDAWAHGGELKRIVEALPRYQPLSVALYSATYFLSVA